MSRRSRLVPEWFIKARKPAEARPTACSGPSGSLQSIDRLLLRSTKVRGGLDQSVKSEVKPASVQRSFSVKRSLER